MLENHKLQILPYNAFSLKPWQAKVQKERQERRNQFWWHWLTHEPILWKCFCSLDSEFQEIPKGNLLLSPTGIVLSFWQQLVFEMKIMNHQYSLRKWFEKSTVIMVNLKSLKTNHMTICKLRATTKEKLIKIIWND